MKIKIFHAVTMQDAMRAIKEELGPDAIILSSKEVREGGRLLRVFNRPVLEIMAAAEQEVQQPTQPKESRQVSDRSAAPIASQPPSPVALQTFQQTLQTILQPNQDKSTPSGNQPVPPSRPTRVQRKRQHQHHMRVAVAELTRLVQDLSRDPIHTAGPPVSPLLYAMRRPLLARGLQSSTVELLVTDVHSTLLPEEASDEESVRRALHRTIASRIPTTGPVSTDERHPTIGIFLGPSGAGKTSTVAKLAAYYRSEQRKSVALITFDTFRGTSVEQLRRYAKLVGVPFACALSARQVSAGLRRQTRCDVVLIDMPGIGPDDLTLATELACLLPEDSVTTHVVLPAFTGVQEARQITARFGNLPRPRLLFTKLDETESLGMIFEVLQQVRMPLSYWSIGRRVPGDLEVASSERLATLLTAYEAADFPMARRQSVRTSVGTPVMTGVGTHRG
ncbi:MAG: flagellar biosynthesis protein FlhF [Nitrospira sp.]|nr:flagellar biosynthesis protein FlhF [Nitrospira sp.]